VTGYGLFLRAPASAAIGAASLPAVALTSADELTRVRAQTPPLH